MLTMSQLARPVLDYVLPPRCPGCGGVVEADHRFCVPCWSQLDFMTGAGCARCSIPLGPGDGLTCGPCLGTPPSFDRVIAAVAYGEIARRVALRLKYGRRTGLARTIAAVLSPRLPDEAALIVPVPLHRWRLWSRGFNQSHAIGTMLAKSHGAACRPDILVRARATPALRGMNPSERRRTVQSAFAVNGKLDGSPVYLIDDVFTTGATADACARALKRAGAGRVTVICWARVLRDD
jgi:ComF family protein